MSQLEARVNVRIRLVLAVLTATTSLVVLSPQPAAACDRQPCYTKCELDKDYVTVGEDGSVAVGARPFECYY